ncbi:hypothetical protein N8699_06800 [Flavobacteriaceae bacterium]|nr:hypothetical protein [Flavobacteriaceae bacterium]
MAHYSKLLLVLSIFLFFSSCENKKSTPIQSIAELELNRGDLLLCGDPNFGNVSFALSCRYDLRETFNLGLSLIHSFEYAEAEKAFVSILDEDPECLMAYWGTAMSILNHPLSLKQNPESLKRGEALLKVAHTLTPNNDREKDYIDAVSIYFKGWQTLDTQTRKLKYESKMEELYNKYTGDVETAVFYSLAILATADLNDKTYSKQKKSGEILEKLFEKNPNHPGIAHYIIHNYDSPELAHLALNTARKYSVIAPASAHAQHMPSHIFTRLGLWDESIKSNIDSANSAVCYAESVNPNASWVSEISVIVFGIAIALLGEDLMQQNEREKISTELKINLLEEVNDIEKYIINRKNVFIKDKLILTTLMNKKMDLDSLMNIKSDKSIYDMSIFGYRGFNPPKSFYNSLVNDGKIRYLESISLNKELDLMHNVNSYYVLENIKLEIVAAQKLKDYFETNQPKIVLNSFDNNVSANKYVCDLYILIQGNDMIKAILSGKISQMEDKIVFLKRYEESLNKIKAHLDTSLK